MSTSFESSPSARSDGTAAAFAACDRLISLFDRARRVHGERIVGDPAAGAVAEPLHLYVLSLLRMRVRPALDPAWLTVDPVHVSLFGGTNSGKSTMLNVLLGRSAAGMNVTARFSQHPEAYRLESLGDGWLTSFPTRFEGYARYDDEHAPRQDDSDLDERGYRPALALLDPNHVRAGASASPATTTVVFWDVPDFSTEEARHWMSAVLDTVALADVVVMAVTDESYADARACGLFQMLSRARADIMVVANKVESGSRVVDDIRKKLDRHWRGEGAGIAADRVLSMPFVRGDSPDERLELLLASDSGRELRRAVAAESGAGLRLKRSALAGALAYIDDRLDEVLAPLSAEVEAAARWDRTVERVTRVEFLERYRKDYLNGERYGDFNQALVRLMDRLEVPGVGEIIKSLRDLVRLPVRTLTSLVRRVWRKKARADEARSPEHAVVAERFDAWLSALRSEAQALAVTDPHPAWRRIAGELNSEARIESLVLALETAYGEYRPRIEAEIRERAEELYRAIADRPVLLNGLRSANLAVDATAIVLVVKSGGLNWSDAILGPVVAGTRRMLFEAGMEQLLLKQERRLKQTQFAAMQEILDCRLREPVQALFETDFDKEEIMRARDDFDIVAGAAGAIADTAESDGSGGNS